MSVNSNYLKDLIVNSTCATVQITVEILIFELKDNEELIFLNISNLLSNAKTRLVGLHLLNKLIYHCSSDSFAEYFNRWLSYCGIHHAEDPYKEMKLNVLAKLLEVGGNNEMFNKKFSSDYLSDVVQTCLHQNNTNKQASLTFLIQCMKNFPTYLTSHRNKIQIFLQQYLENCEEENIEKAAFAFHLLQQTGPAGVDGINYINNFFNQLKKLCATVHVLYEQFFEDIDEIDSYKKIADEPFVFKQDTNELDFLTSTSTRIINCIIFIRTMISKQFPVEKRFIPNHIVELVCRGLSLHICLSQSNVTTKSRYQSLLLCKVQVHLFKLLEVFINGYFTSVIPFSYIISHTLANSLKRTFECSCFTHNVAYKLNVYRVLNRWMTSSKNIDQQHFIETLLPLILKDVSASNEKHSITLDSRNHPVGAMKIKTNADRELGKRSSKERISYHALEAVKNMFVSSWARAPKTKEILSIITKTVANLQMKKEGAPYVYTSTQVKLYEILISFLQAEHSEIYPINLITSFLTKGQHSNNWKVSKTSSEGLRLLKQFCDPPCNSMYFKSFLNLKGNLNNYETVFNEEFCGMREDQITSANSISVKLGESISNTMLPDVEDHDGNDKVKEERSQSGTDLPGDINQKAVENPTIIISETESLLNGSTVSSTSEDVMSVEELIIIEESPDDETEEPLTKKSKTDDENLDMFCAFQDVTQE